MARRQGRRRRRCRSSGTSGTPPPPSPRRPACSAWPSPPPRSPRPHSTSAATPGGGCDSRGATRPQRFGSAGDRPSEGNFLSLPPVFPVFPCAISALSSRAPSPAICHIPQGENLNMVIKNLDRACVQCVCQAFKGLSNISFHLKESKEDNCQKFSAVLHAECLKIFKKTHKLCQLSRISPAFLFRRPGFYPK